MYEGRYQSQTPARKRPARRRKLNKYFLVTLSLFLLLGIAGGTTLAYVIDEGGTVENSFTPAEVKCSVGDDYAVTNTGNVDAYIRAAVVINWENADGDVSSTAPVKDTDYKLELGEDWEKIGEFYYYKKVVAFEGATETTTPVVTVTQLTDGPDGFVLIAEILAEAIQADGMGADSAYDAWAQVTN